MLFSKYYSLHQCKSLLQKAHNQYQKYEGRLQEGAKESFRSKLLNLQDAIDRKDKASATASAKEIEQSMAQYFPKSSTLFKWAESALALVVALAAAVIIRQMWFELYEIPTGSMRPTFKEQDHLTVSKTQFGLNVPMETAHFYFNEELVKRGGTIIFSGDNLPLMDTDTTFLGVFPYKKRYVKRLIGKPGDQVTFYGGKIYGLDRDGKPLSELLEDPYVAALEHIPFIGFEGQPKKINPNEFLLYYYYQPLGKVILKPNGQLSGQVFNGTEWVDDHLSAAKTPHNSVQTLSDLFGMRGFTMTQLYSKAEMAKDPELRSLSGEAPYYLVLRHTPHLDFSHGGTPKSFPKTLKSALPLEQNDLQKLMDTLYTARFLVDNGRVQKYSLESRSTGFGIDLNGVPNGTYEFYHGKAYSVGFGGITSELSKDHPIYNVKNVQTLYNLGIQWDHAFQPGGRALPSRYAYFRDGDFYVLGYPLFSKESEQLKKFADSEQTREEKDSFYVAFKDQGAPQLTQDYLKHFGLTLPEKSYLVLGDNHAMSGDSRVFGYVPQNNLQGVPEFIFWPPGDRIGRPAQEPYSTLVPPRLIVWAIAAAAGVLYYFIRHKRLSRRIHF